MKRILRMTHRKSTRSCGSRPSRLRRMPRRHVLLATLVAVIWGVNFVVIHVGLDSFPPLLFAALRFCLVALALPVRAAARACPSATCSPSASSSPPGQFGLLFLGIDRGMPAGLASLVLQLQAAFTVGLAVLLLGERPRPAQLAGGALALAGIGIIAAGRASAVPLGALALCVGAAACWGVGNVATRKAQAVEPARPARLQLASSRRIPLLTLSPADRARRRPSRSTPPACSRCSTSSCSRRWSASASGRGCSAAIPRRPSRRSRCWSRSFGIASAWLAARRGPIADRAGGRRWWCLAESRSPWG